MPILVVYNFVVQREITPQSNRLDYAFEWERCYANRKVLSFFSSGKKSWSSFFSPAFVCITLQNSRRKRYLNAHGL